MQHNLGVSVEWTIYERIDGLWVPIRLFHNLLTTFGLSAYATAAGGTWQAPIYLVIDTASTSLIGDYPIGSTAIQLAADPTIAGDTALVLGPGQVQQETAAFNLKTGTGPFTFTLVNPIVNAHYNQESVVRAPTVADTVASVVSEAQYDPVFAAGKRTSVASAYAVGGGKGTIQFFIGSTQATGLYFAHIGMADKVTIGTGNLHNYAALGYSRNSVNDLEIDVNYQLTNV